MNTQTYLTSPDLYAAVRAGFVRQRTTLNRWCIANSISRQNARQALLGEWTGPKARQLIDALIKASQCYA